MTSTARVWRDRILLILVMWGAWVLVTTFLIQPFAIPSGSMENTLRVGDRIVVNRYSAHFGQMKRGDIVVFQDPGDWTQPVPKTGVKGAIHSFAEATYLTARGRFLVKRVVGVGGDTVSCQPGGKLTVNGTAVTEPYLMDGAGPCDGFGAFAIRVPAQHVWVMGDNRSHSADSRFHDANTGGRSGSVPLENVVGKNLATLWPVQHISGSENREDVFAGVPTAR